MNFSTQEFSASRRNPFEHYPKPIPPQAYGRAKVAASNASHSSGVVAQRANPAYGKQPSLTVVPRDAQERARRRQQFIKKRQFNLLQGLRRAIKLLGVLVLVFILLPSSMQKRIYQMMPFTEQPKAAISHLPPLPVNYDYISSPFGRRWGRQHQGIDFAADVGQPIYAVWPGTVSHSGWEPGYGKSVVIDHGNGVQTRYAHCSRLLVKAGALIPKGGVVALVGSTGHSTGPHLHFEVLLDGTRKNPANYFSFDERPSSRLASAQGEGTVDASGVIHTESNGNDAEE